MKGSRTPAQIPGGFAALSGSIAGAAEFSQSIVFYADLVKAKSILIPVARKTYTTAAGARTTLAFLYGIEEKDSAVAAVRAATRLISDISSTIYSRSGLVGIAIYATDPLVAQQLASNILAELDAYWRRGAERRR